LRPGERFVDVTMPNPYTPVAPNGGTDEYRCFVLDPELTGEVFLTGSQFTPQNAGLVHHAVFRMIGAADTQKAAAMDAKEEGDGWRCFGDRIVDGATPTWLAAWAPGSNEVLLDPDLGYRLPPGSLIVAQVHYNLLATGGKPGGSDQSSMRMRFAEPRTEMKPLVTLLRGSHVELPCTPEESGPLCDRDAAVADVLKRFGPSVGKTVQYLTDTCGGGAVPPPGATQSCEYPVKAPATVHAGFGHMHLLGRSIKVEVNPGTPQAKMLLDVPNFNFHDQGVRVLPEPVSIVPGDRVRVSCTHDASLRSKLPELAGLEPRYVVWGDGTADEMCMSMIIVTMAG
jgi:Copper type II ascorbate-dependent monooxygenase, C-terminal domain